MQSVWTINQKNSLLLFFSGWGMDEKPTAHLTSSTHDVCTCFNYNSLQTTDISKWRLYDEVVVVAWSMGVWAAEQVIPGTELKIKKAVALNGTPKPVDDSEGIPVAVARGTLDGLTPATLKRFYRRMFGGTEGMRQLEGAMPEIDFEERKEELRRIIAAAPYTGTGFKWDRTIVSLNDAIFPPQNMLAYWQHKAEVSEINAPHYPFHHYKTWEEIIGE